MQNNLPSTFISLFENLEERVLFDAVPDVPVISMDVVDEVPAQAQEVGQQQAQEAIQLIVIDGSVADSAALIEESLQEIDSENFEILTLDTNSCLLYTSPSPRDQRGSRMPSSA